MYVGFGKISAQLHTLIMHTPRLWDLHHCFEDFLMIFFCQVFFSNASNIELHLYYKYCIICVRSVKMSEGNLMCHPRLAWDQAQQWGKKAKMGLNRKNIGEQIKESLVVAWGGERVQEPGDMPLMPPFHDTRFWYHALICSDWSNVFMLTHLRCC